MLLDPAKFDRIVQHARATNPFYRDWIADPSNVPILTRTTFLENNDLILNGRKPNGFTSGSTGIPVRLFQSPERTQVGHRDTEMFVTWLGGRLPSVQIVHSRAEKKPPNLIDIIRPIDEQIDFIIMQNREKGAAAITTYPTNAVLLAERVQERGLDMSFIRRFGVYAEPVEDWHRASIKAAFPNAKIWTTYSSTEVGVISLQCPHEPDYQHVMTHRLGIELLDDQGHEVPENVVGRLIVTDYLNFDCPFIRYEIGDLVERASCPCGKIDLPAFRRVFGKVRGAIKHRDGRRIVFADLSIAFTTMSGVRQFQVIQEEIERFTVKLVARDNLDDQVKAAFEKNLGYLPDVRVEYVDVIPRDPNGKFYSSICRV